MTEHNQKKLPDAVYLDTGILQTSGANFNEPWMTQIRAFAKEFDLPLHITDLTVAELCEHISNTLKADCEKLLSASAYIRAHQIPVPPPAECTMTLPEGTKLIQIVRDRLINAGFQIIENSPLSYDQLINEAVQRKPPFTTEGNGLCKAILLESFAQHALQNYENPSVIVISNDDAIIESGERFTSRDIDVQILRAHQAIDAMKNLLGKDMVIRYQLRENNLLNLVRFHEQQVLDFVKSSLIQSRDAWLQSPFTFEDEVQGSVQSIVSAKPVAISKVVGGCAAFPQKIPWGRYPVAIWVSLEIDLAIVDFPLHHNTAMPYYPGRKQNGAAQQPSALDTMLSWQPTERQETVYRDVYVEATVRTRNPYKSEENDLRCERIL
ncbi:DUF4935 domain-containing protein [Candidatus Sumerlaeota bacterium]|nr:DUF4935 domain-containing protein [Candidatus Sumerlaeota bacterium]